MRTRIMKHRVFMVIAILVASAGLVFAQSGRRSTSGSTSTPATTTPSVTGPRTVEKKPPPAPKLQLLVGIARQDVIETIPYYLYDTVLENVVRRLSDAEIVFVNSGGKMNRAEAVHAAKEEKVRWVVNLEIRSIYGDLNKQVKNNQDELYVRYVVLEPETAKIKHSGQSGNIYQNGRGGVSLPTKNAPVYSEYAIKQAATQVADKILADFDISVREGAPFSERSQNRLR